MFCTPMSNSLFLAKKPLSQQKLSLPAGQADKSSHEEKRPTRVIVITLLFAIGYLDVRPESLDSGTLARPCRLRLRRIRCRTRHSKGRADIAPAPMCWGKPATPRNSRRRLSTNRHGIVLMHWHKGTLSVTTVTSYFSTGYI